MVADWSEQSLSLRHPDARFRISVAAMKPIPCEEPVSEGRDDTSTNNDRSESRPGHTDFPLNAGIVLARRRSPMAISGGVHKLN